MTFLLETETEEVDFEIVRLRPNLVRPKQRPSCPAR